MDYEDALAILKAAQNPALEAIRQMEELTGRAEWQRAAREMEEAHKAAAAFAHFDRTATASTEIALQAARSNRLIDSESRAWQEHACAMEDVAAQFSDRMPFVMEQILGHSLLPQDSFPSYVEGQLRELVDANRVIKGMTQRFGGPLPGYIHHVANIEAQRAAIQFGVDAFAEIAKDFDRLRSYANALEPLQHLARSMANAHGLTAANELQRYFDQSRRANVAYDWTSDYRNFAALIEDTWGNLSDETEPEPGTDDNDKKTDAAEAPLKDPVWSVATVYMLPAYELQVHLKRVAGRIDPNVHGEEVSWDRMLHAISYAYPAYATQLTRLAYPLLQQLDWTKAPRGQLRGGAVESATATDAEAFKILAAEIVTLLKKIP